MLDDPGLYGPRRPLPLRVGPVPGESTGSFVNRLAHANGLSLAAFLDRVGQGEASAYPERVEKYPQSTEMYVNEAGLRYLAVLADLSPVLLQRDLPSLGAGRLLAGGPEEAAEWRWPWEPVAGHLVRYCPSCGDDLGVGEAVWLMSPDSWQVCLRHGYWSDDARGRGPGFMELAELPETVTAHRLRQELAERWGQAGEELFADSFQVAVYWWTRMPDTVCWVRRAWAAGLDAREMRAAPLVIYPEAAELARAMLDFERAGQRDTTDRSRWLAGVEQLMAGWGVDVAEGRQALLVWLGRHRRGVLAPSSPAGGSGLLLGAGHSRIASRTGPVSQRSCLTWQLGMAAADM
ncbi:TniQ family protein [Streptomyces cellulosae]|uniref:TniQ family protein n=1 Tax=Streptomyces cellulosae TaxID=1968 RepID=UPI0022510C1B|nr:TniQ family protein [Streptomyces cellulosae]MCX4480303.1 TniQ family protein [Streptomyces cellulosae]WTB85996.1 TniQ family protein [Streptomyces cellulosae]WTB86723.1 TniQ family protein [Streptomyces cellulosae]WTB86774.1 TniQ family protein [Streptomyces cellulosae]